MREVFGCKKGLYVVFTFQFSRFSNDDLTVGKCKEIRLELSTHLPQIMPPIEAPLIREFFVQGMSKSRHQPEEVMHHFYNIHILIFIPALTIMYSYLNSTLSITFSNKAPVITIPFLDFLIEEGIAWIRVLIITT